jgi:uncharacterized protein (DUF983 family)
VLRAIHHRSCHVPSHPLWRSIVRQLCRRSRSGSIFRSTIYWGFAKMNDRCPVCGLLFNREPGYFLDAMYISYGLALALLSVFGLILLVLTSWRLDQIAIWAILALCPNADLRECAQRPGFALTYRLGSNKATRRLCAVACSLCGSLLAARRYSAINT